MQNHLSYRWPTGPSATPPAPPQRPRRRLGRAGRITLIVLGCAAGLAGLILAAFWGMMFLAGHVIGGQESSAPRPSYSISRPQEEDWSPDELPWGEPDPEAELSLSRSSQQVLTPQEIYQSVLPSVVCVQASRGGTYSVGSGVIASADGYIITNYHILQRGTDISVMLLSNQLVYDAVLVGYDEELDLAVLKVDAPDLTPARLADSDQLQVGDQVYAIGNPMGYLYGTMTEGIVSSLAREVEVSDHDMTLIQTSAALNSGNSGGALVDVYGQVVGITSAKITGVSDDVVTEGIGLAIPITDSLPFLNHIIQTGETCRPALGVMCSIYTTGTRQQVVITEITPGSPAEGILQVDDQVVAVNGRQVDTFYQLSRALNAAGVGGTVELTVLRDGDEITVSVTLYDSLTAGTGS